MTKIHGIYDLEEEIGEGGMAKVYRAKVNLKKFDYIKLLAYKNIQSNSNDKKEKLVLAKIKQYKNDGVSQDKAKSLLIEQGVLLPKKNVAVKLANENSDDQHMNERFESEWKSLISINHPNIISIYDGGVFNGSPFYVLEHVKNTVSPETIIDKFPIRHKLEVILQAAQGIAYLHQNGIIHRDIKPNNLLVERLSKGVFHTKIIDLGTLKNFNFDMSLTLDNTLIGSPNYASPEQLRSTKDVDFRTDIYSLGATLYEFTTNTIPYEDKTTIIQILDAAANNETPINPKELSMDVSDELADVIFCAMAPLPDLRYQTAAELIHDLKLLVQQEDKQELNLKDEDLNYFYPQLKNRTIQVQTSDILGEHIEGLHEEEDDIPANPTTKIIAIASVLGCLSALGAYFYYLH